MGKLEEMTERESAVAGVLRELRALPPGATLPNDQAFALLARLPRRSREWTSADVIRELRGPLPEDDPSSR